MLIEGKIFRVFLSSTVVDLTAERNALDEHVWPALRELCETKGARFQAIDLRWGVSAEAARDQKTMEICLSEIDRCRNVSPRPNFVILLGQRYGWRPIPSRMLASEYDALVRHVGSNARSVVEEWYQLLDDNADPPQRILKERPPSMSDEAWTQVETMIRRSFQEALQLSGLDPNDRRFNGASATEQEIFRGALAIPDAAEHVVAVFRESEGQDLLLGSDEDADAAWRIESLKNEIRAKLGKPILPLKASRTAAGLDPHYLSALCLAVETPLREVIEREIGKLEKIDADEFEESQHRRFGRERRRHFRGRTTTLNEIEKYLAEGTPHPLVLVGDPGCGKSAIMAQSLATVVPHDAVVIQRFIGATPASLAGRTLLEGILRDIARKAGDMVPAVTHNDAELNAAFEDALSNAARDRKLVIFVDGLDQLAAEDPAWRLLWIPATLKAHVRLVLSVLPGPQLERLRGFLPSTSFVDVPLMTEATANEILDLWFSRTRRKLQPEQRAAVLEGFRKCQYPLYLRIAFDQAVEWRSFDPVLPLAPDIHRLLRSLLEHLSADANHGKMMVSCALGLIAAARHGLTEDELLDLLSADEDILGDFRIRSPKSPPVSHLPVAIWSRLRHDLSPYLAERAADGTSLLSFYHQQFRLISEEMYLAGENRHRHHRSLATYFASPSRKIVQRDGDSKIRDLRMISERVYQQRHAEMWEELEVTLLDTFEFLEAKAEAGLIYELADELRQAAAVLPAQRERRHLIKLLEEAIRRDVQSIYRHPETLFQCCWNSGWWHDCPEAATHYETLQEQPVLARVVGGALQTVLASLRLRPNVPQPPLPPWRASGPKLSDRIALWRTDRQRRGVAIPWLREVRPPISPLESSIEAILRGHGRWVRSACFSPDGRFVASGGDDQTVRVWPVPSANEVACLWGHEAPVQCVRFSPDGLQVLSASNDKTIRVWHAQSGKERLLIRGHANAVESACFSPHGERIASGSADGTVRIWDSNSGKELRCLRGHDGHVSSVAFCPAGKSVVSASQDKTVRSWDIDTGQEILCLRGHKDWVTGACFTSDGRHIVSASFDKTIRFWNGETGRETKRLTGHQHRILSLELAPDGRSLISASHDLTVRVWDIPSGKSRCFRGHEDAVTDADMSSDGRHIVSSSRDGTVRLWNANATAATSFHLREHGADIEDVDISTDGRSILTACSDGVLGLWDAENGRLLLWIRGHRDGVPRAAFSPDGLRAISASRDGTIRIWNATSGACIRILNANEDPGRNLLRSWESRPYSHVIFPDQFEVETLVHSGDEEDPIRRAASIGLFSGRNPPLAGIQAWANSHWPRIVHVSRDGQTYAFARDRDLRIVRLETA